MKMPSRKIGIALASAVICMAAIGMGKNAAAWKWGRAKSGVQLAIRPLSRIFHGGQTVGVAAEVRNIGPRPWRLWWPSNFGDFSINFSVAGPRHRKAGLTAYQGYVSQFPPGGSAGWIPIKPRQTYSAGQYVLDHYYDMTLPGIYHVVGNCGPVSPPAAIQIASPKGIMGPVIKPVAPESGFVWGAAWHGLQLGVQLQMPAVKQFAPVLVNVEIRNVGPAPKGIHLAGLCAVDFADIRVTGPTGTKYISPMGSGYLIFTKTKLTAYGRWLKRHPASIAKPKTFVLSSGKIYLYGRPLLINRRFDLTLPGVYRMRVELAGTGLKSGTVREAVYDNDYFSKPKPKAAKK